MRKQRFVSDEGLRKICSLYSTPFHLYNEAGIRQTTRKVNKAFSWNKNFREYYAVKACPNPFILKILHEEGCGVDCASVPELMLAQAAGFKTDEIMFSSNETTEEEYRYALSLGAIINLDDITHIDFLKKCGEFPEKLCLRFNPGGELFFGKTCMGHPAEAKYGMTRSQIFDAVIRLQEMGVKKFGLHALLASNAVEEEYYPENAHILMSLAWELQTKLGADIFMINLSGGIGIDYRPEEITPDILRIGEKVKDVYYSLFNDDDPICVAAELGRFITGPHGCLVTSAVHFKHIYREYVGLDACAVDLMRPAMYGAYHHVSVVGKDDLPCDHVYDVVGSLCENNDKFAEQRKLPEIEIGDIVVIHDTGAHGYSMGYNYNGKLKSKELLLHEDGHVSMIRRAETPADYFATFDFCDIMKTDPGAVNRN